MRSEPGKHGRDTRATGGLTWLGIEAGRPGRGVHAAGGLGLLATLSERAGVGGSGVGVGVMVEMVVGVRVGGSER
jgi:hypothetical protein